MIKHGADGTVICPRNNAVAAGVFSSISVGQLATTVDNLLGLAGGALSSEAIQRVFVLAKVRSESVEPKRLSTVVARGPIEMDENTPAATALSRGQKAVPSAPCLII